MTYYLAAPNNAALYTLARSMAFEVIGRCWWARGNTQTFDPLAGRAKVRICYRERTEMTARKSYMVVRYWQIELRRKKYKYPTSNSIFPTEMLDDLVSALMGMKLP